MSVQQNKKQHFVPYRDYSSNELLEDMSQIFGRLWYLFRVFGILPFQVKRRSGYWFYNISVEGSLYCAVNLIAMSTLVAVSQRESPRSPISVATNSSSWLDSFIILYGNVLGPACLLLHWSRRRSLFLLAKTLLEVDHKLQALTSTPLMTRKIYAFLISIVVPSLNLTALISLATMLSAIVSLPLSFWLSSCWSKSFIFILQYQFIVVQVAVKKRFAALNFLLEDRPPSLILPELTRCIRNRVKSGKRCSSGQVRNNYIKLLISELIINCGLWDKSDTLDKEKNCQYRTKRFEVKWQNILVCDKELLTWWVRERVLNKDEVWEFNRPMKR